MNSKRKLDCTSWSELRPCLKYIFAQGDCENLLRAGKNGNDCPSLACIFPEFRPFSHISPLPLASAMLSSLYTTSHEKDVSSPKLLSNTCTRFHSRASAN